jgi:hypothetical protein
MVGIDDEVDVPGRLWRDRNAATATAVPTATMLHVRARFTIPSH